MDVAPVWYTHGLRGSGQIIAIADSGLDTGDAGSLLRDLRDRLVAAHALGRPNDWSDPDGHGTHVAGSAGGASSGKPVHGRLRQLAAGWRQAGLVMQSVLDDDGDLGGCRAMWPCCCSGLR
jgi:subtilisin family serine protease